MIRRLVTGLIIVVLAAVVIAAIAIVVAAPRLDWGATAKPPVAEKRLAGFVLHRWIRGNAPVQNNPLPATAENMKEGQREFTEHCAVCHGIDGSAHDLLGAEFYPPIARLERGSPGWSDGQLYYIITHGIRYTGMPGFGAHHDADDIWKMILWIRHLPHLTPAEKAELSKQPVQLEHGEQEKGGHSD